MIKKSLFKKIVFIFSNLGAQYTLINILKNILFYNHYYELHVNLNNLIFKQKTRIKYSLKRVEEKDILDIAGQLSSLPISDRKEIIIRLFFYEKGFKNCYVAKTAKGDIAYMQWIIYPQENSIIRKFAKNRFPLLYKNQVFIENAFAFPRVRGLGLLWSVTLDLLEIAKSEGYENAFTFVKKENIFVINDFIKIGFKIKRLVPELKLFGYTKRFL